MHAPLLFPVLILTSLLIQFRTICLGNDATHSGLSLLTSISLSHSSIDMPQAHQIDKILLRLSSQVALGHVKLTMKVNHHTCQIQFFIHFPDG